MRHTKKEIESQVETLEGNLNYHWENKPFKVVLEKEGTLYSCKIQRPGHNDFPVFTYYTVQQAYLCLQGFLLGGNFEYDIHFRN